jgi:hypothetical protein
MNDDKVQFVGTPVKKALKRDLWRGEGKVACSVHLTAHLDDRHRSVSQSRWVRRHQPIRPTAAEGNSLSRQ